MASPSVSPNPWAIAAGHTEGDKSNPWATAARNAGGPPENPWATAAQSGSGKSPHPTPGPAPSASTGSSPSFARTPTDNPIINALSAGNRFTKHLVATGKLGLPDAAGEAADDATIDVPANAMHAANEQLPGMLQPFDPRIANQAKPFIDLSLAIPGKAYGAAAGLLGKGLGAGARAGARGIGSLLQYAPTGVQEGVAGAVRAGSDVAQAGANAWGDLTHWGGSAHRELDPASYRNATLSSNLAGAEGKEYARRLAVEEAAIFHGLTPAQQTDAVRLAKGEIDVASDPAVNAAGKRLRGLLDNVYQVEATKAGESRVALGHPKVANAAFTDLSRAKPVTPPRAPDAFEQMVPDDVPLPRHPSLSQSAPWVRGEPERQQINRAADALTKSRELPPELREFNPPGYQGTLGPQQYRGDYFPGIHNREIDSTVPPKPFSRLFPSDPQALPQRQWQIGPGDLDVTGKPKIDALRAALQGRLKGSARQVEGAKLRDYLGIEANPSDTDEYAQILKKLFAETATPGFAARNPVQHIQAAMRVPGDLARAGMTAFGLKHGGVNVPTLAALSEGPQAVGGMAADAAKTMRMSPEEKWEFQRPARDAGVLGPDFEHRNWIVDNVDKLPRIGRAALGGAFGGYEGQDIEGKANPNGSPLDRLGGSIAGAALGAGAGAGRLGSRINELTWTLDNAARARSYGAKAARGMPSQEAAMEALHDTIDYGHQTPLSKGLRDWGLAPFATFATKVPGAVIGSVARDPRKAMLLDRLTNGLATEGTIDLPNAPPQANGKPGQFAMPTPLSEGIEAVTNPGAYVRAKASVPAQAIGSLVASALSGDIGNVATGKNGKALWPSYGKPLLPHKNRLDQQKAGSILEGLLHDLPLGAGTELLDATGTDEYAPQSAISQILGPIVGGYVR